jgi:hypothetical protein
MSSPLLSKDSGDDLTSTVYEPVGVVSITNSGVFGVIEVESRKEGKERSPQTLEE